MDIFSYNPAILIYSAISIGVAAIFSLIIFFFIKKRHERRILFKKLLKVFLSVFSIVFCGLFILQDFFQIHLIAQIRAYLRSPGDIRSVSRYEPYYLNPSYNQEMDSVEEKQQTLEKLKDKRG